MCRVTGTVSGGGVGAARADGDGGRDDIRIELQRGNVRMTLEWPREAMAQCAAWMRELLR